MTRTEALKNAQKRYREKLKGQPRSEALKESQKLYRQTHQKLINEINAKSNRLRYYYDPDNILRDVRRLYVV